MPEIKNHFTGGKMNKDVDERLIPKGQYRDAMNIQVSTSEESDVGSVQNLLGNSHGCSNYTSIGQGFTVGSISDEKNDSFYWFVSGQSFSPNEAINNITNEYPLTMHDSIWKHDSSGCTPVFIDKFGISQTTNLTTNSDVLTSINIDVYNNLEEGWKVFGYNITDGSSSNTAVISSTLPAAPVWANFDSVYNYTPSTTVAYYEVLIPMTNTASSGSPANFVQSTGNVVYLRNFSGSVNGLPGNTIEILPYDASNAQTYTIDTATNFGITINTSVVGGSSSTAVTTPVIKLELTTNLSLISPALSLSQAGGVASSNAPYADVTSSGGTIDCLISFPTNTPVATATGTVYLPSSFNFNSISVGEEVYPQWLNSINTVVDASASICIGAIDASTNSIDLEYCNTGIAFDGWQVGGFVYGVPQLTGGAIQFSSNISVQLYSNLDLSSGYSHLFFYGPRTLNFNHNQYITAINIVDDMLFWTDGKTEPKKINIPLSIQGTTNSGADLTASKHTRLINPDQNIFYNNNKLARERHLTVIRKAPKNKLTMELYSGRKPELNYSGVLQISAETNQYESSLWAQRSTVSGAAINPYEYDFSSFTTEEGSNLLKIQVDTDLNGNSQFDVDTWEIGSTVVLKAYQNGVQPVTPITDYDIKGTIVEWPWTNSSGTTQDVNSFTSNSTWGVKVAIKIDSMPGVTPIATSGGVLKYVIDLWEESEKLFEFKFPRFSYRYKYIDGEYSTFAPFTDVAFSPGSFDYHPRKGYNLGMSNNLESLTLRNFINDDMPSDVVEIDILYKEDKTPDVFVVETFNRNQEKSNTGSFVNMNNWMANEFTIEKENIKSILPSNQLLRPWDNVPRTALAQEITGNRIVYGNYTQNYNLKNPYVSPNFSHFLTDDINTSKSIKSLREYQLGVVFIDQYGRETPVLTHNSGLFKVGKEKSISSNKLYASVKSSSIPQEMKYLRFYIKETSGEYYNLAMDRWYDAEDDNIWLAFPSSDRDKVDIDTFLILKKGVATSEGVEESARYKILAIENEAPDFIKTEEFKIAELIHDKTSNPASGGDMYDQSITECPIIGQNSFRAKYGQFDGSTAQDLDQVQGELYVDFTLENSSRSSKKYRITEVVKDVDPPQTGELVESPVAFVFKIEGRFEEDVNFITDDAQGGTNATRILNRTITRFYKRVVENSPKFDGRFFVKIYFDDIIQKYIKAASETGDTSSYYTVASKKIYSLSQDLQDRHDGTAFPGTYNKVWKGLYNTTTPNNDWYFPYNMYVVGAPSANILSNHAYFEAHNENAFFNAYFGAGVMPPGLVEHWSAQVYPRARISWHAPHGTTDFFDTLDTFQVRTEDIWCIDFGVYRGYYESDMVKPGEGNINAFHTTQIQETDSSKKGIVHGGSESTMSLSFGGLRPSYEESSNSTGFFGPFYDISDPAREYKQELTDYTNPSSPQTYTEFGDYSDDAPIASRLFSGYKFRWKEDPSQTVYTITGQTKNGQLVNYQPIVNLIISADMFASPANYRKNWTFNVTPKMQWDPVQGDSLGVITEGLDIRTYQPSTGVFNNIEVSSNFTTNNNSILHIDNTVFTKTWDTKTNSFATITPGLILTEINSSTTFNHDNNPVLLYSIEDVSGGKKQLNFIGYQGTEVSFDVTGGDTLVFRQPTMNGLSINSARNINTLNTQITGPGTTPQTGIGAVGYTIEFIEPVVTESLLPDDPAVWETEPKNTTDLDLYYEAGDTIPLELNNSTNNIFAPIGTVVSVEIDPASTTPMIPEETVVLSWNDNIVEINNLADDTDFVTGDVATFLRPDGSSLVANVIGLAEPKASSNTSYYLEIDRDIRSSQRYGFTWNNCYSFGNGVESNRIRDNFNQPFISNGVKVSSTLSEALEEEHRKHGLIYSGIYNSTSGINNLNQFIQAEKITKDINPTYGSIQKLYAGWGQQGNLIALCEDRILKILANKDALFNADGDSNVTATNRVLGTATPYSGEYGISKNPESFAAESYRAYFSDKVRGTIMRLSLDGLTPISSFGMKDWFKDNLRLSNKIIGSYDDQKEEYNVTLHGDTIDKTVTFREDVKGWVSFKSFTPENAISCANRYYTFLQGKPWKHHDESVDRNTFYGVHNTNTHSTLTVVLNEMPGVVKSFNTINYEGSQSSIRHNTLDNQYYNLQGKPGWVAADIHTDLEKGSIEEFIEKEGKWFNYIRGRVIQHDLSSNIKIESDGSSLFDQGSFAIQGLGVLESTTTPTPVNGCTNPVATNYDPLATVDDGSCIVLQVDGCTISSADNFNPAANTDDGLCVWGGCIDPAAINTTTFPSEAINYSGVGITDDGSCTYCVDGCTDPTAFNYNASATCDDNSCIPFIYGCAQPTASNYDSTVNSDDGSCIWSFCPEEQDNSYGTVNGVVLYSGSSASIQAGMNTLIATVTTYYNISSFPPTWWDSSPCTSGGCMNQNSSNYDSSATWDDGTCGGCTDPLSYNYVPGVNIDDGSCSTQCDFGCGVTGNTTVGATSFFVSSFTNVTNAGSSSISDLGSITIEQGQLACFVNTDDSINPYPYSYSLSPSQVGNALFSSSTSVGPNNQVTYSGLDAGTYTITATSTLPHQNQPGITPCSISITQVIDDQTPISGCTDSAANNHNSAATVDDGSCTYTVTCYSCVGNLPNIVVNQGTSSLIQTAAGDCTSPPVTNFGSAAPENFTLAHALATYGDSGNGTPAGQGCNLGCTDSTALNYNSGYNNNFNQTCEYCDMYTDTNGDALGSPIQINITDSTSTSGNGVVQVLIDSNAPYFTAYAGYDIELYQVSGPSSPNTGGTLVQQVLNSQGVSMINIAAGYYYVKVTTQGIGAAGNTCSHTSSVKLVNQVITGCMSIHATNYNSSADIGMYNPNPGGNSGNWLNSNNDCNNGNPAPGHCCFTTVVKRCGTNGLVESSGSTYNNQSNRAMPAGAAALGWKTYAQQGQLVASNVWKSRSTGQPCLPGCTNALYCEYDNLATWRPYPPSNNNASAVDPCQTYSGGVVPKYNCNHQFQCQSVSVCDPGYATATYNTLQSCNNGCIAPAHNTNQQTTI